MIEFDAVTITYADQVSPVLRDVDLHIAEGEFCLVAGPTGSGKTSLLTAVNGLFPHFTGGTLAGRVVVDGRDTAFSRPRDLADLVGYVGQDPLAGFTTDTVEEELAYGMEQMGVDPGAMRKRVEETLDLMGLAEYRDAPLHELSGGQQQRVAIGAVLTTHPRILVLDEPTSALDPSAAEEVLAALTRLVHDLGITAVVAEHRLERVVQYADAVVVCENGTVRHGLAERLLARGDVAPPVVQLGRLAGWEPLPLSVRDARRAASGLRDRLAAVVVPPSRPLSRRTSAPLLSARDVSVRYGDVVAVRGLDLELAAGEVTALMGRNGSGKSSLLWALQGSGRRSSGTVDVRGVDPQSLSSSGARRLVGLVPQTASDLLYFETVAEELGQADNDAGADGLSARTILERIAPGIDDTLHPRDLSEGQRLALVLAIQLAAAPPVILLDEPTRGLDYRAKDWLRLTLDDLAAQGRTLVVSTHDVEFAAAAADRVVVMAEGEVVADGPTADVLVASPAFAPQVAKILAPAPVLSVAQVVSALNGVP